MRSSAVIGMGVLVVCGCALGGCAGGAKTSGDWVKGQELPKRYDCAYAGEAIVVDGKLDDAAWADAAWTDLFVDIEGDLKPKPRFDTRAKMMWDDEYFYVCAKLEEPHVWGAMKEHDLVIWHENDFEIFIDPDGDCREYYEIEINALGTIFDLFLEKTYRDGGPARHEWTADGMKSAVHVEGTLNDPTDEDVRWTVEFALPWKLLAEYAHRPSPPNGGDVWRVNFSRVQWRHEVVEGAYRKVPKTPENNWVWSPQGEINMHAPEHWGEVRFLECADD